MRFSCLKKESLAFIRSGLAVSCVLLAASLLAGVIAGPFKAESETAGLWQPKWNENQTVLATVLHT